MSWLAATPELLRVAQDALRERVQVRLDREGRYEAAMVARALAIAIRELELGEEARAEERELLAGLHGDAEGSLDELRQRLCRDLRSGSLSPERAAELPALLLRLARGRLAISNPDYGAEPR